MIIRNRKVGKALNKEMNEGTLVNIGQLVVYEVLQANFVAHGQSYKDHRGS